MVLAVLNIFPISESQKTPPGLICSAACSLFLVVRPDQSLCFCIPAIFGTALFELLTKDQPPRKSISLALVFSMATAAVAEPPAADTAVLQEKAAVPRETVTGPLQTPIAAPTESSRPAARPALSDTQKVKYDWLLQQARAWTEIRSDKGKGGPITDDERMWLSQECLLRYLRATKWHEKDAATRLQETLTWRRDYGVEELTAEHSPPENETGKQIILGYDKQGRVCHYLNPGRQNTDPSPRQVQHHDIMEERVNNIKTPQKDFLALL